MLDADGLGVQAPGPAREVVAEVDRAARHAGAVEDDDLGVPALRKTAALAQADEPRGLLAQLPQLEGRDRGIPGT